LTGEHTGVSAIALRQLDVAITHPEDISTPLEGLSIRHVRATILKTFKNIVEVSVAMVLETGKIRLRN
jgi:hypothetical protein